MEVLNRDSFHFCPPNDIRWAVLGAQNGGVSSETRYASGTQKSFIEALPWRVARMWMAAVVSRQILQAAGARFRALGLSTWDRVSAALCQAKKARWAGISKE